MKIIDLIDNLILHDNIIMNETAIVGNSFSGIQVNDSTILVIATFILCAITGYYAIQTRLTVREMQKASELSVQPFLKASLNQIGPVALDLLIQNIGNGGAVNINLKFWIDGKNETQKSWTKPLLKSNEGEEFLIPKNQTEIILDYDFFKNNQTTIIIKGEYTDILGKSHKIDDKINITEYVKQMESTNVRYIDDSDSKK